MIWKKLPPCFIATLFIAMGVFANNPTVPWSVTVKSADRESILVLLSPKLKEQRLHIDRLRMFWSNGGIPKSDVASAEKFLDEQIELEDSIRSRYPQSGLYSNGVSPELIWSSDLYSSEHLFLIGNDRQSMVSGKFAVTGLTSERSIPGNPNVNEIEYCSPDSNEIVLSFYSSGKLIRSYTAFEITQGVSGYQKTSANNFLWRRKLSINDEDSELVLELLDGTILRFNLRTGERTFPIPSRLERSHYSNCFGLVLVWGLTSLVAGLIAKPKLRKTLVD